MSEKINFSAVDREVIFLLAALESIDSMANFEMLALIGKPVPTQISFKSMTHRSFFGVLLVDFLSAPDKELFGVNKSLLSVLKSITQSPCFDVSGSVERLKTEVEKFSSWLEAEVEFSEVWLPAISKNVSVSVRRVEFIKISGDVAKHNFTRLTWKAKSVQRILMRNGISVDLEESIVLLEEFNDFFYNNILTYHSSSVVEFLNNLRWAIHDYLRPEFSRSWKQDLVDPIKYTYDVPMSVTGRLAVNSYWTLMNKIRSEPYMQEFVVGDYLKGRY